MNLIVRQMDRDSVYTDTVRIPKAHRKDKHDNPIDEGTVCEIAVNGRTKFVAVRGTLGMRKVRDSHGDDIFMDEKTRNDLNVSDGSPYDFRFCPRGRFAEFRWAWNASNPVYRVAARSSLISVVLGVVGVILGIIGLLLGVWSLKRK